MTRPPYYSIALISGAALAFEVYLMRLFSVIQWQQLAHMIISLALLGYAASGTLITLLRAVLLRRFSVVYPGCLLLFSLTTLLCTQFAEQIVIHPEEVLWNPWQVLRIGAIYLILAVPFLCAATAIGLALVAFPKRVSSLYARDLLGAGIGSAAVLVSLNFLLPMDTLRVISMAGGFALATACWEMGGRRYLIAGCVTVMSLGLLLIPQAWLEMEISPYKGLSQALRIVDARVVAQRSSMIGQLSAVASPTIPWRYAPGLSLNSTQEPPAQIAVFIDADAMTAVTYFDGDLQKVAYLDQSTGALPYHVSTPGSALLIGAEGGATVLRALLHRVPQIEVLELDSNLVDMIREDFAEFSGNLYRHPNVTVHTAEARLFIATAARRFDLIQLASLSQSGAGGRSTSLSYAMTVEAVDQYLEHLAANGILTVTSTISLPPRNSLKLANTALSALRLRGIAQPQRHIAMIRSWQDCTLLIRNEPFRDQDIAAIKAFSLARSFDVAYYPGMAPEEANQFNRLDSSHFYDGISALAGDDRHAYLERYKFDLSPATDEKPFFSHFFKWRTLAEINSLRDQGGLTLLESSYLVLVATLVQALLLSLILIPLPLWIVQGRWRTGAHNGVRQAGVIGYFLAIGLAFLFLEIAFMNKLTLFLQHPIYSMALVLTAFLVFAGLGSAFAQRLAREQRHRSGIMIAVLAIGAYVLAFLGVIEPWIMSFATESLLFRAAVAVTVIAPLAFCMGLPFPLGMDRLGRECPELMPWAWAINGCASVVSAVLATLLAIHFGFSTVMFCAAVLYVSCVLIRA